MSSLFFILAYDLAKNQKLLFGDDISAALRKAKRKRFLAFLILQDKAK